MRRILNRPRTHESTCSELARQPLGGVAVGLAGEAPGGVGGVELLDHSVGGNTCFGPEQCLQQHSSGGAVEDLLRRGRGGGEGGWLERAASAESPRRRGPLPRSIHLLRKSSVGSTRSQPCGAPAASARVRSKSSLGGSFNAVLEEQDDDAPLRERPENPIFRALARRRADDDDRGAALRGDGPSLVRIDGARQERRVELRDVEARLLAIRRDLLRSLPDGRRAAGEARGKSATRSAEAGREVFRALRRRKRRSPCRSGPRWL